MENIAINTNEEWDELYNKAIILGDYTEIQKIRDLHWKAKAPKAPQYNFYHGTKRRFTQFKMMKTGEQLFHFGDKNTANFVKHNRILEVKLNVCNPLQLKDSKHWDWLFILKANPELKETLGQLHQVKELQQKLIYELHSIQEANVKIMQKLGADAFTYINNVEGNGELSIAVPSSKQIKLADAITYDDEGKIIPISKRDDFNNPDIRY